MILRDMLIGFTYDDSEDGQGGYSHGDPQEKAKIQCKISKGSSPEQATSYGLSQEEIMNVVSFEPLQKNLLYKYEDAIYQPRLQTQHGRFFYSTLVEIKEGKNVQY